MIQNTEVVRTAQELLAKPISKLMKSQDAMVVTYREARRVMKTLAKMYSRANDENDQETANYVKNLLIELTQLKKKLEKKMGMLVNKFDPAQSDQPLDNFTSPDMSDVPLSETTSKNFDLRKFLTENKLTTNSKMLD